MSIFNVKSKRIIQRTITVILFVLLVLPSFSEDNTLYTSENLSSNRVKCVCQDKTGYIWVGTDYGLNKYDGYHFKTYFHQAGDNTSLDYNMIVCMYVDKDGTTWIGTAKGIQRYDVRNDRFIRLKFPFKAYPRVTGIIPIGKHDIWISTDGYGLYKINKDRYHLDFLGNVNKLGNTSFTKDMYKDSRGNVWICGDRGKLSCINPGKLKAMTVNFPDASFEAIRVLEDKSGNMIITCSHYILRYSIHNRRLTVLKNPSDFRTTYESSYIDKKGDTYIGTNGNGLYILPNGQNTMERYDVQNNVLDINKSYVSSVFNDKNNNMWIGCCYKGVFFVPNRKNAFTYCNFSDQGIKLGMYVADICSGSDDGLICLVQNDGMYFTDSNGHVVKHSAVPTNTICIHRDRNHRYWLGLSTGLASYDPVSGATRIVPGLNGYFVNKIDDDGKGNLYVSLFGHGFCQYNTVTHRIVFFDMDMNGKSKGKLNNNWILALVCDSHGFVWLGDTEGLCCYCPEENSFLHFGWKSKLDDTMCISFCEYDENRMLIGTTDGLFVFNRKTNRFSILPQSDQLKGKEVTNIFKDGDGDIWVSTSSGIWLYQLRKKVLINYLSHDGLTARDFTGKGYQAADGRIFLGTSDGYISFLPSKVKNRRNSIGNIQLTNFIVGNKTANCSTLSNGSLIMDQALERCHEFNLSYIDNTCSMEFSTMNFDEGNIQYEYKINNDKSWTLLNKGSNSIELTHLKPGTYKVDVRVTSNGSYSPSESYYINVSPPWYSSIYAYVLYFIIFAAIVILSVYLYIGKKKEELNSAKMQFMVNTTHDIRSPLTLILNPVKKLMSRIENKEDGEALNTVYKNAQRILGLVNQLLDVKKIEAKQFPLHYQETDMVNLINEIVDVFSFHARERGIDLSFTHEDDKVIAWIDRTNIDKILMNLMSNAFKFTGEKGKVSIVLSVGTDEKIIGENKDYVEIRVMDNGVGIREKDINRIFDRFYQSHNSSFPSYHGSGIGLNLCKLIVELHHGSIAAENLAGKDGVCFTVRLPKGDKSLCKDKETDVEVPTEMPSEEKNKGADAYLPVDFINSDEKKSEKWSPYKMLLVDDDEDICKFVKDALGSHYKISVCHNGKDALKELLCNEYDIVVSDVMMPEMDGLTLVHKIKSNPNVSHIPVVLLTSKTEVKDRISGFDNGADAYISKPFDIEELDTVVRNQIKNVIRLKGKFSGAVDQQERLAEKEIKGFNDQLMDRIMESINNHLSDSEYSIDVLTADVGISRSHLYRKMKEMTGLSVTDFIKNLRLERAAKLIREHKVNISYICFDVGFSNLSYFSTVFKKHFGVSPREYAERYN